MEAVAKTKYLKGSPRKARLVIDLIRGVNVSRALSILKFTDKRAADPIQKCLNSAIANATFKAEQQNIAIDPDDLWVKACFVDMGPHKNRSRMRPAPQGRAYREQRHYCHITIQVTSEEKAKSEEQIRLDALRDERIAARKVANAKKKAAAPAPAKKEKATAKEAKVENADVTVEELIHTPSIVGEADVLVHSPVEPTAQDIMAAADEISGEPSESLEGSTVRIAREAQAEEAETQAEAGEEVEAKNDAEISAAHGTSTHTTAEEHATKPADEVMEKNNETLERHE